MRHVILDVPTALSLFLPQAEHKHTNTLLYLSDKGELLLHAPNSLFLHLSQSLLQSRQKYPAFKMKHLGLIIEGIQSVPIIWADHTQLLNGAVVLSVRLGLSLMQTLSIALALCLDKPVYTVDEKLLHLRLPEALQTYVISFEQFLQQE